MSKEKKKPKQQKTQQAVSGQPTAAVEAKNQPHNTKQEALGANTKRT